MDAHHPRRSAGCPIHGRLLPPGEASRRRSGRVGVGRPMTIGQRVRALLGPAEPAVGRIYRGLFFDLAAFADEVRRWTDAATILEVGCGDGLATEQLRRAFPRAAIT